MPFYSGPFVPSFQRIGIRGTISPSLTSAIPLLTLPFVAPLAESPPWPPQPPWPRSLGSGPGPRLMEPLLPPDPGAGIRPPRDAAGGSKAVSAIHIHQPRLNQTFSRLTNVSLPHMSVFLPMTCFAWGGWSILISSILIRCGDPSSEGSCRKKIIAGIQIYQTRGNQTFFGLICLSLLCPFSP